MNPRRDRDRVPTLATIGELGSVFSLSKHGEHLVVPRTVGVHRSASVKAPAPEVVAESAASFLDKE